MVDVMGDDFVNVESDDGTSTWADDERFIRQHRPMKKTKMTGSSRLTGNKQRGILS